MIIRGVVGLLDSSSVDLQGKRSTLVITFQTTHHSRESRKTGGRVLTHLLGNPLEHAHTQPAPAGSLFTVNLMEQQPTDEDFQRLVICLGELTTLLSRQVDQHQILMDRVKRLEEELRDHNTMGDYCPHTGR